MTHAGGRIGTTTLARRPSSPVSPTIMDRVPAWRVRSLPGWPRAARMTEAGNAGHSPWPTAVAGLWRREAWRRFLPLGSKKIIWVPRSRTQGGDRARVGGAPPSSPRGSMIPWIGIDLPPACVDDLEWSQWNRTPVGRLTPHDARGCLRWRRRGEARSADDGGRRRTAGPIVPVCVPAPSDQGPSSLPRSLLVLSCTGTLPFKKGTGSGDEGHRIRGGLGGSQEGCGEGLRVVSRRSRFGSPLQFRAMIWRKHGARASLGACFLGLAGRGNLTTDQEVWGSSPYTRTIYFAFAGSRIAFVPFMSAAEALSADIVYLDVMVSGGQQMVGEEVRSVVAEPGNWARERTEPVLTGSPAPLARRVGACSPHPGVPTR